MRKSVLIYILLLMAIMIVAYFNLFIGEIELGFTQILDNQLSEVEYNIFYQHRLPKLVLVILVGIAMPLSGLLMQTLFKNPLAGPSILGISSTSNLFVALLIYASVLGIETPLLKGIYPQALAAMLGAFIGSIMILSISYRIRNNTALLLTGVMLSGLTTTLIALLKFFGTKDELKNYLFWSFGTIDSISWTAIALMSLLILIATIFSFTMIKPLNALLLGDNYARTLGVNVQQNKRSIILIVAILTGAITAFCGPIAFIGLVIPYLARMLFQTANHETLIIGTILIGVFSMIGIEMLTHIMPSGILPINIVISLIGLPIILYILIKQKNLR